MKQMITLAAFLVTTGAFAQEPVQVVYERSDGSIETKEIITSAHRDDSFLSDCSPSQFIDSRFTSQGEKRDIEVGGREYKDACHYVTSARTEESSVIVDAYYSKEVPLYLLKKTVTSESGSVSKELKSFGPMVKE